METESFCDTLLDEIRSRFCHVTADPACGRRIYLDNAGGSLKLHAAVERAATVASRPDNAGRDNPASRELEHIIAAGRSDAALFLGATSGQVITGESTTANVFRLVDAALGAAVGGNVVTTQLEHPCTYSATKWYARQYGLQCRVAPVVVATGEVLPEAMADQVDQNTVAVACIHASNVIGTRVDVRAVADAVRQRNPNTFILVDGSQHAPHGPIDVESLGVDAYCFAPYKAFSVPGVCFAWISQRLARQEHPRLLDTALNYWELGTRNAAAFAAWSAVIDYLALLGTWVDPPSTNRRSQVVQAMRHIECHERGLTGRLLTGLAGVRGLKLIGVPDADERREAVFAFSIEGIDAGAVVQALSERGIVTHVRRHDAYSGYLLQALGAPDCVRVSLAHYNTPHEMDALLDALNEIAS